MRRPLGTVLAGLGLFGALQTGCRDENESRAFAVEKLPGGGMLVANAAQGAWSSEDAWRLREVARFGGQDAADTIHAFGSIAALELDEQGHVYVLDRIHKQIRVFRQDGSHVRTFGGAGGGPGELENPIGLAWESSNKLWVVDAGNARYTMFDTAGSFVASHPREITGWGLPWRGGFGDDGFFYEPSYETDPSRGESSGLVRHEIGETVRAVDSLSLPVSEGHFYRVELEDDYRILPVPFAPRLAWMFDGAGGIWFGTTDSYRVVHRGLEGDTMMIVGRAFEPDPVTPAEKAAAFERLADRFNLEPGALHRIDRSVVPSQEPVFQSLAVDDAGYLWVFRGRPDETTLDARRADVFDPRGRFLGTIQLQAALSPRPLIRGNRVVVVARDQLEVPQVVIYELRRGAGESPQ